MNDTVVVQVLSMIAAGFETTVRFYRDWNTYYVQTVQISMFIL